MDELCGGTGNDVEWGLEGTEDVYRGWLTIAAAKGNKSLVAVFCCFSRNYSCTTNEKQDMMFDHE